MSDRVHSLEGDRAFEPIHNREGSDSGVQGDEPPKAVEKSGRRKRKQKEMQEVSADTFNYDLDMKHLDRITEGAYGKDAEVADKNRKAVIEFRDKWINHKNEIRAIGFNSDGGRITEVRMKFKNDYNERIPEAIVIPIDVFAYAFNIKRLQNNEGENIGLIIGDGIHPSTPELKVDERMNKFSIGGETLEGHNVEFYVIPNDEEF